MRILFVEDELSKNIPRVIRLFRKYLGEQQIKRLQEMESDDSGYGIDPDQIKAIIEETNLIEVEYRFPEALKKVIHQHQEYSLFIIDRNLVEARYDFEEISKIDSSYTESQYQQYSDREGDYLLYKLAFLNVPVSERFYYLTAYSGQDEIRGQPDIESLIEHFGDFKQKNFIEKGNEADLKKLISRIENNPLLSLLYDNRIYLKLLRNHIDDDMAGRFIKVLREKDEAIRIGDSLKDIRIIYDDLLRKFSDRRPEIKGKPGKDIIKWLADNGQLNSIIRNFAYSIYGISSDFGGHDSRDKRSIYSPTTDTVNALVHALKDMILWLDQKISTHGQ
ncbi:hypothetical protein [Desulfatirhabdium butyrativorans]|uniref:hypothetical protein n=1 Tax=Desulfatirhabdium butyrativorans TaxID=340467 RepID=UPI000401D968|nr:hypothetical protein [Desulfatirhabdium butyrativorans]